MKLHAAPATPLNTINAYGPDYIMVNEVVYESGILVRPEGDILTWPITTIEAVTTDELRQVCALEEAPMDPIAFLEDAEPALDPNRPEVLLIGTGIHQHMMSATLLRWLHRRAIGVEVMSTPAAARTYNVLKDEGRLVVAALMLTKES